VCACLRACTRSCVRADSVVVCGGGYGRLCAQPWRQWELWARARRTHARTRPHTHACAGAPGHTTSPLHHPLLHPVHQHAGSPLAGSASTTCPLPTPGSALPRPGGCCCCCCAAACCPGPSAPGSVKRLKFSCASFAARAHSPFFPPIYVGVVSTLQPAADAAGAAAVAAAAAAPPRHQGWARSQVRAHGLRGLGACDCMLSPEYCMRTRMRTPHASTPHEHPMRAHASCKHTA